MDEAPLQAVVLADSYNRRFEVLCTDQPRVLLPLCSTPLLAWTLESLSLSKVKQVFIFCGVHADKIRAFVESSPYRAMLDIHCLSSQTARSAGDALRELDDMHVSHLSSVLRKNSKRLIGAGLEPREPFYSRTFPPYLQLRPLQNYRCP